jgi:hypothetical protein
MFLEFDYERRGFKTNLDSRHIRNAIYILKATNFPSEFTND